MILARNGEVIDLKDEIQISAYKASGFTEVSEAIPAEEPSEAEKPVKKRGGGRGAGKA